MRFACTTLQAMFSGAKVALSGQPPLSLTLDCHDRPPFILRVQPVTATPWPDSAGADLIRVVLSLAPAPDVAAQLEAFAASHKLSLAAPGEGVAAVRENLMLAACHESEGKFFFFSENAVLTARRAEPGEVELMITGTFRARRLPCTDSDVLFHLDAPAAGRLLSFLRSLAKSMG